MVRETSSGAAPPRRDRCQTIPRQPPHASGLQSRRGYFKYIILLVSITFLYTIAAETRGRRPGLTATDAGFAPVRGGLHRIGAPPAPPDRVMPARRGSLSQMFALPCGRIPVWQFLPVSPARQEILLFNSILSSTNAASQRVYVRFFTFRVFSKDSTLRGFGELIIL